MAMHRVDLATWARADQYRLFRGFQKPHYAVTARVDMSHVMARKAQGVSPYRASLFAIGAGVHSVPELCMRFHGDEVVRFDAIALSMTVPRDSGTFGLGYLDWTPDFERFDAAAKQEIDAIRASDTFEPNAATGDAVAYLSCLPWLDYTSISNALPGVDDCIPRISWGKIVPRGDGYDMAMTIEVHHALVDGAQLGTYFQAVQRALDSV